MTTYEAKISNCYPTVLPGAPASSTYCFPTANMQTVCSPQRPPTGPHTHPLLVCKSSLSQPSPLLQVRHLLHLAPRRVFLTNNWRKTPNMNTFFFFASSKFYSKQLPSHQRGHSHRTQEPAPKQQCGRHSTLLGDKHPRAFSPSSLEQN